MLSLKKAIPAVIVLFVLLYPVTVMSFDGPLQVRNQFPLFVPLDPPYLESAAIMDSAAVSLSHSSVYVTQTSPAWTVNMDLELTERCNNDCVHCCINLPAGDPGAKERELSTGK